MRSAIKWLLLPMMVYSIMILVPHTASASDWGTCDSTEQSTVGCKMQQSITDAVNTHIADAKNNQTTVSKILSKTPILNYVTTGSLSGTALLSGTIQGLFSSSLLGGFVSSTSNVLYAFAKSEFSNFSSDCYKVACYLFAIWLVLQSVYTVLGLNSGSALVMRIAKNAMYLIAVTFLIGGSNTNAYWEYFIVEPLKISSSISSSISIDGTINACSSADSSTSTDTAEGILVSHIGCMEGNVENIMKNGIAMGLALPINQATVATGITSLLGETLAVLLFLLMSGFIIMIMFGLIIIYYAFFLIDIVLRLCVVSAFAPFFIGLSAIPASRKVAVAAFTELLGAFVNLTVMSILIGFEGNIMYNAFQSVSTLHGLTGETSAFVTYIGGIYPLIFFPGFWEVIIVGVSSIALARQIQKMFEEIFGVKNSVFAADRVHQNAQRIAAMAVDYGSMGLGKGMRVGGQALGTAAKGVGSAAKGGGTSIARGYQTFQNAGGISGYRSMFRKGKG